VDTALKQRRKAAEGKRLPKAAEGKRLPGHGDVLRWRGRRRYTPEQGTGKGGTSRSSRWPTPGGGVDVGREEEMEVEPWGEDNGNGEDVISAFVFNLTHDCYGK
jgi:hypothetical protein